MGSTSAQGVATLVFLVAFVFLSMGLFAGGNVLYLLVFVVGLVASIALYMKAKATDGASS